MEEENQYSISIASEEDLYPTPPDILDASNITSSSFTVNWIPNNSNENLYYEIFYKKTSDDDDPYDESVWTLYTEGECIGGTSAVSTNITGLSSATYYDVKVQVWNEDWYGYYSYMTYYAETLSGSSGGGGGEDPEPPPENAYEYPTILAAKDITSNSFTMSWIPNNVGVALTYEFQYKKSSQTAWNGTVWMGNTTGSTNTRSFTFVDLEPSTSYDVWVKVYGSDNRIFDARWENYVTTLPEGSGLEGIISEDPTILEATNIKRTSFTVNWIMNNDEIENIFYIVAYKSTTETDFNSSNQGYYDGGSTQRSLTLTGLTPGTEYEVFIAIKQDTVQLNSKTISVTTLGGYGDLEPPTMLAATNVTGSSFTANWKMNNEGVKDISWVATVILNGVPILDEEGVASGGSNASCTFTQLLPNTTYNIEIRLLKDGYTETQITTWSYVTTGDLEPLQKPSIQLPIIVDGGKITVNWTTNNDLQVDYEFYVNDIKKSEACGTVSSASGSEIRTNTFYVDRLQTTYRLKIVIKYRGYADSYTEQDFTSGTLTRWEWNATEIDAFTNHKSFFLLTAVRWRDFINKYNSVMYQAQGMGVVDAGNYLVESAYIAVEKGSPLTANDFNSITRQIEGCLNSAAIIKGTQSPYTRPTDRTAGVDIVYGHYFTDLSDGVNWLIDILLNN